MNNIEYLSEIPCCLMADLSEGPPQADHFSPECKEAVVFTREVVVEGRFLGLPVGFALLQLLCRLAPGLGQLGDIPGEALGKG